MSERIRFNRPHVTGHETEALREAVDSGVLSGNGPFARRCCEWLGAEIGGAAAFVVPSCTAALEMAVALLGVGPGDEVVMPSFTFVSTANAVVLRGGTPVFVDVRPDTLNIDVAAVEAAITDSTRAVICVHYGGVGCDIEELVDLCSARGVPVIEDAAHCIRAWRNGRPLGSFGALSTFSFHETKNVQCGEGGALVVNDPKYVEGAEILQEKGTNRRKFLRGQVDKYTWVAPGSSYLLSEVTAAFLWVQMQQAESITARRLAIWKRYHNAFAPLEAEGRVQRPVIPDSCIHNAHLYHLRLADVHARDAFIAGMEQRNIQSVFHYIPLHDSPAGVRLSRAAGSLDVTTNASSQLARLPVWVDMTDAEVERVIAAVRDVLPLRSPA